MKEIWIILNRFNGVACFFAHLEIGANILVL